MNDYIMFIIELMSVSNWTQLHWLCNKNIKKYAKYKKIVDNAKKELESVTREIISDRNEIEVVIYKIEEKEYLVEEDTNVVYDEDATKIGYYFNENVLLF